MGRMVVRAVLTQSPVNPGDSGGPVVNDLGQLVAVTAGGFPNARLMSFFISVTEVRDFVASVRPMLHPRTAREFNSRGLKYYNKGWFTSAEKDFNESMRLDPEFAPAHHNRGFVFWYGYKDYQPALRDLNKAIRLNPCARYYTSRGRVYLVMKDYENARADFEKALRLDPNYADAYHRRGDLHSCQKDYARAVADCTKAIELDSTNASFYNVRGLAYRSSGKLAAAIEDYTRAIKLMPDCGTFYFNRAYAYRQRGDYESADADYARMEMLDPRYARGERKQYHRKYLRIANETGEPLEIHVQYLTMTKNDEWKWFPGPRGSDEFVEFGFEPGEVAYLRHDDFKINAERIRIWATTEDKEWSMYRRKDLIFVRPEGYSGYYMARVLITYGPSTMSAIGLD